MTLSEAISSPYFVGLIVTGLLVWTAWSAYFLRRASRVLQQHLGKADRKLRESPDAADFARVYEAVSSAFSEDHILCAPWCGFLQCLIVPETPDRPVTATASPRQWFELSSLFRRTNCDQRYHAALPGLLVGTGLLFTFFGLAVALSAAGSVVSGTDVAARNTALTMLLNAASIKFITSLAGLFFSIFYALFRKSSLRRTERVLDQFLSAVDERLPYRSAASFQVEANQTLANQYREIQRIGMDFFVNLSSVLEREFDQGLQQHIGPLAAAIEKLSAGLANQNEDAMKAMLSAFLERLQGSVGENMSGTAATLEKLSSGLESIQAGLDTAARKIGDAAEEMAAGIGRGTQSAMAGISEQMGTVAAGLREVADQSTSVLAATIARAADGLEAAAAKVADTLGGGAADASGRLVAATEAMRDDLRGVLDRFGATLSESGAALTSGARAGGDVLLGAASALGSDLGGMAARLREAGEAAGSALREGGAEARTGMTEAGRSVLQASSGLADRLAGLGAAASALAEQAAALNRAANEASGPLVAGATDLRAAGEAARASTNPLRDVAQSLHDAVGRLSDASSALTDWQRGAAQLAGNMNGLDEAMANTLRGLNEGLSGYHDQVSRFFSGMDSGLSRSVQGLTVIAENLEKTAEELADARVRHHAG